MEKKEFTKQRPKENNDKSDAKLIELLDGDDIGDHERDSIKAILDVRAKEVTTKHNQWLIIFTIIVAFLTLVLVYYAKIQTWPIYEQWKINENKVERDCKNDPNRTITFENGTTLSCSEYLEKVKN